MTDMELLAIAEDMRARAYAPYSGYLVGAVVKCADGRIYTGCNIENASYGACICAERAAIAAAVSDGNTAITTIAVSGSGEGLCTPCGICRQVIYEFAPECTVICGRQDGPYNASEKFINNTDSDSKRRSSLCKNPLIISIKGLLPHGFGPSSLS